MPDTAGPRTFGRSCVSTCRTRASTECQHRTTTAAGAESAPIGIAVSIVRACCDVVHLWLHGRSPPIPRRVRLAGRTAHLRSQALASSRLHTFRRVQPARIGALPDEATRTLPSVAYLKMAIVGVSSLRLHPAEVWTHTMKR